MSGALEKYRDDLPELIRGRLDPDRAGEILRAAGQDAELREAIESERSLERWLEYYEVPEPAAGFERRFWARFHEERVAGGRSGWLLKLAGPLAAGVLIALGVILFVNTGDDPGNGGGTTADTRDAGGETGGVSDDVSEIEIDWDDTEFEYIAGGRPDGAAERLDLRTLELLKALDDPAFLALDDLQRPDDMLVIDELDLIAQLAEDE
jgi:hypothetical protein